MKLQKSVIVASGDGRIKGSCVLCVDESSVNNREQSGEIYFFVETGERREMRTIKSITNQNQQKKTIFPNHLLQSSGADWPPKTNHTTHTIGKDSSDPIKSNKLRSM